MIINLYHCIYDVVQKVLLSRSLKKMWKRKSNGVVLKNLSSKQKKDIQDYYIELIGKKVDTRWHCLLYSITGVFDKRYMPFDVYHEMINKLSPWKAQRAFDDKNLYRQLLNGFIIPERIAECYNGVYFIKKNGKGFETTLKGLCDFCANIEECIIKPSCNSSSGNGIKAISVSKGNINNTNEKLPDFLYKYHGNFVIEKKVHECENLQCLNPTSCNTVRIHTYRNREKGTIEYVSSFLRIGAKGSVVDNANAGGMAAFIMKDGTLDYAFSLNPYEKHDLTPSGISIKGYKIENLDRMITTILRAHENLPMFDFVGWDVAVDNNNQIVIIEYNPNPDLRMDQVWYRTTLLLEKQEEILRYVYNK